MHRPEIRLGRIRDTMILFWVVGFSAEQRWGCRALSFSCCLCHDSNMGFALLKCDLICLLLRVVFRKSRTDGIKAGGLFFCILLNTVTILRSKANRFIGKLYVTPLCLLRNLPSARVCYEMENCYFSELTCGISTNKTIRIVCYGLTWSYRSSGIQVRHYI